MTCLVLFLSYLVMPYMGTDLGKLMKLQRLSEDKIQYLVYQMLKGLKVRSSCAINSLSSVQEITHVHDFSIFLSKQYIHSVGIIHRVSFFNFTYKHNNDSVFLYSWMQCKIHV